MRGHNVSAVQNVVEEGRSNKKQILLIPGFLHGDKDLATLARGLSRSGYETHPSGIKKNIYYSEVELRILEQTLHKIATKSGRKVTIIGHSRGGALGKVLADRNPSYVEKVIALSAPLNIKQGARDLSNASTSSYVLRRMLPLYLLNFLRYGIHLDQEKKFLKELAEKPKVPLVSVYSKSDTEVSQYSFVRQDAEAVEVDCKHEDITESKDVLDALVSILRS